MADFSLYIEPPDEGDEYLIPMFSVPLFHLKLKDWEKKKSELMSIYEKRKSDKNVFKRQNGKQNIYDVETDYHHNHDTGENYDEEITNILRDELEILSDTFQCSVEVCTTWFEKASKGKQHSTHNHGPTGFSAVCFVEFDPEYHTPTVFLNPNLTDQNVLNFIPPGVSEGSLIFFPSYVLHYTEPNTSEKDRLILSFNTIVEYDMPSFKEEEEYE